MKISKHLAEHAVSELLQMGYTVDGDRLNPPEKLSDFACKFFGVTPPSPPEGMAGWKLVPIEPTLDMGWAYLDAAMESEPLRTHSFNHAGYRAMIAAAPPLPASEAKEL